MDNRGIMPILTGFITVVVLTVLVKDSLEYMFGDLTHVYKAAAWILIGVVVLVVTLYKLTAVFGVMGGWIITRDVKHRNNYGVDRNKFPKK